MADPSISWRSVDSGSVIPVTAVSHRKIRKKKLNKPNKKVRRVINFGAGEEQYFGNDFSMNKEPDDFLKKWLELRFKIEASLRKVHQIVRSYGNEHTKDGAPIIRERLFCNVILINI